MIIEMLFFSFVIINNCDDYFFAFLGKHLPPDKFNRKSEKVLKGTSKCGCSNTYLKFRIVPQETMDYGLFRNQSLPPMRGQNPEALMAKFSTLQRSTSAPQQQFTGKSV